MDDDPAAPAHPLAWTRLGGERVFESPWLTVRADRYRTPDGGVLEPWYVLEYADWVNLVVLDAAGDLVMVRQFRPGLGRVALELPAGAVDPDDADPAAAASRELREETGYAVARWEPLGSYSPNPASHDNRVHYLLGRGARRTAPRDLDAGEFIAVEVLPVAAVRAAIASGEVVQALHVAALLLAFERLARER